MVPLIIFCILFFLITYCKNENNALKATKDRTVAHAKLEAFMAEWDESPESNLSYIVPTAVYDLGGDCASIKQNVTYQALLREKNIADIVFFETHCYCIDGVDFVVILDQIKDDEDLYNRVLHLIMYKTPKK